MTKRRTILDQVYPFFILTVLVVVVISILTNYYLFREFRFTAFRLHLLEESRIIAGILADHPEIAPDALLATAENAGSLSAVVYETPRKLLASTEDALPPPPASEIRSALRDGNREPRGYTDESGRYQLLLPVERKGARLLLVIGRRGTPLAEELSNLFVTLLLTGLAILVATSILLAHLVRRIKRPLQSLQRAATAYAEGNLEYRFQISKPQEMALLAETMNGMAAQLTSRIRAISNQRNELEAILGGMVEGVILIGEEGRIRTINDAACNLFSVDAEKVVGHPLLEALRNSELFDFYGRTMSTGGITEGGIRVYDAENRYIQAHGTVIRDEGAEGRTNNPGDVLLVLNDITRIKRLETIRQEFVANVSHELKTPITSILGFVETLQDGAVDDPASAKQFLGIIDAHTRRLDAIIDDLLQLARLEQSQGTVPMDFVDPAELLRGTVDSYRHQAKQNVMDIVTEIVSPLDRIFGNKTLLERAVANLVDNGIKYSPAGTTITLRAEMRGRLHAADTLRLTVTDQGPGIPPVEQGRVFERFYRIDKNRSRQLGGTGLGLAIVKHVARVHGGSVDLESERGRGSSFILEIPTRQNRGTDSSEMGSQQPKKELHGADEPTEYRPKNVNPL